MTKIRLIFEGLPTFESSPIFYSLDDDVDLRLRGLPETYARCNAALRFMSNINGDVDQMRVRRDELESMRVAYLRAALMEFVGMEDSLIYEVGRDCLRISNTRNAMLVALRELRNVQIHLVRSELLSNSHPVVFSHLDKERTGEYTALTIPRADLELLKNDQRGSIRHYHREDFQRAVEWLNEAQQRWGISEVVMHGIWTYASAIVDEHVPRK